MPTGQERIICPVCGQNNMPEMSNCFKCGASLAARKPTILPAVRPNTKPEPSIAPNEGSCLCPYCRYQFDKPIKLKRACSSCKRTIVIRGGNPVTEDFAKVYDQRLAAKREAKRIAEIRQAKRDALKSVQRDMRQWKQMGVTTVVFSACKQACAACMALDGRTYTVDEVIADSPIPVNGCENDFCCCAFDMGGNELSKPSTSAGCAVLLLLLLAVALLIVRIA